MPVYQYACPDCGHAFEQRQKFSDNPIKKCPHCQRHHVYRVVSNVAVMFKGSGWYITDNRSDRRSVSHDGAKNEQPSTNGKGDKTEPKAPETKATESVNPSPATKTSEPAKKAKAAQA